MTRTLLSGLLLLGLVACSSGPRKKVRPRQLSVSAFAAPETLSYLPFE